MILHPDTNKNRNRRERGVAVTPGLPHWSEEINARRPSLLAAEPRKPAKAKITQCPAGMDHRFTVKPGDPIPSVVNPAECRPWAKVAR